MGHFPLERHLEKQPQCVREWINSQRSETTKRNYILYWEKFTAWLGKNGDAILEMRIADFKFPETDRRRWRWEDKVKEYYQSLYAKRDPPKPTKTDRLKVSIVRSFFSFHRMPLVYRREELTEPRRSTKDYTFKMADIEAMKEFADAKESWVLLGGKSLGQRAIDFINLKRTDIEPYLSDADPIPIVIQTSKMNVEAHPCIDPDAKEAAINYLAERTDDNPYMLPGYGGKHLDPESLTIILRRLADAAHRKNPVICPYQERGERLRFHRLRAFLNSELQMAGVDKDLREAILGHKLGQTTAAYTSEEYRNAYLQAVNQGRLVLPKKVNEVTPKIDSRLLDVLTVLFKIFPEEAIEEAKKKAKMIQLSAHWDPDKEPVPAIYLVLEALKKT